VSLIILNYIKLSSEHSQDRQKRFQMWVWPTSLAAACPSGGWELECSGWGFHLSHSFFYYADCFDVLCGTPLSLPCPHSHIAAGSFLSIHVWDYETTVNNWDKARFQCTVNVFF